MKRPTLARSLGISFATLWTLQKTLAEVNPDIANNAVEEEAVEEGAVAGVEKAEDEEEEVIATLLRIIVAAYRLLSMGSMASGDAEKLCKRIQISKPSEGRRSHCVRVEPSMVGRIDSDVVLNFSSFGWLRKSPKTQTVRLYVQSSG